MSPIRTPAFAPATPSAACGVSTFCARLSCISSGSAVPKAARSPGATRLGRNMDRTGSGLGRPHRAGQRLALH